MKTKIILMNIDNLCHFVVYKKQHFWSRWEIVARCLSYDEALNVEFKTKINDVDTEFKDVVVAFVIAIVLVVVIVAIGITLKHFV